MKISGKAAKLTVFVGSDDRRGHRPVFKQVLKVLRERDVACFALLHGAMSFGQRNLVHSERNEVSMNNLPVVIEATDTEEKITAAAEEIAMLLESNGIVQIQPTTIAFATNPKGSKTDASKRPG